MNDMQIDWTSLIVASPFAGVALYFAANLLSIIREAKAELVATIKEGFHMVAENSNHRASEIKASLDQLKEMVRGK